MERFDPRELLSEQDLKRIDAAVSEAEGQTSGEIVPVVAGHSDDYEEGRYMAGLSLAFMLTLLVVAVHLMPLPEAMSFLQHDPWDIPLYVLLPAQALGLLLGGRLATSPGFRRAFVSQDAMRRRVRVAAQRAFRAFHLTGTRDHTGVLIYVSLYEHMVVVLADKAIAQKHGFDTWSGVRDRVIQGIKDGELADGYVNAIKEVGKILAVDFPPREDDENELPNHLRVIV